MKITKHQPDENLIWFPALLIHEQTDCVALFYAPDQYTVIDPGKTAMGQGEVSNIADTKQWNLFKGYIKIQND